jgi:hypothetical protein
VFAWYGTKSNAETFEESTTGIGAILTGRRTSDAADAWGTAPGWRADLRRLAPAAARPSRPRDVGGPLGRRPRDGSPPSAGGGRRERRAVAGGDTVRQLLALGRLDEVRVSLVPVLLGRGVPYFPVLDHGPVELEGPEVRQGDEVTHLHYRVARSARDDPDRGQADGTIE